MSLVATRSLIPIGTAGQEAGVLAGRDLGVDRSRSGARHVWRGRAEGMDVRLEFLHATQNGFGDFGSGKLLVPDFRRDSGASMRQISLSALIGSSMG